MTKQEIKAIIIEEILNIAPDAEEADIPTDARLQTAIEFDSYDFLTLLTAMNERLGVEVPEKDYGQVGTLNDMVDYFAGRIG